MHSATDVGRISRVSIKSRPIYSAPQGVHSDSVAGMNGQNGSRGPLVAWREIVVPVSDEPTPGFTIHRESDEPAAPPAPRIDAVPHAAHRVRPAPADGVLATGEFFDVLALEQRRADRNKAPLSLLVCRLPTGFDADAAPADIEAMLSSAIRETDFLAQINASTWALLFPDTEAAGTQRVTASLRIGGVPEGALDAACYPGEHFRDLVADLGHCAAGSHAVELGRITPHRGYRLKRALDIAGALLALVVFSPLMLLAALAVRLTSPGPVIFRQVRLGAGGVPFVFYKFRSMTANIDDTSHRHYVSNLINGSTDGGGTFKMKSDPRITRVGRFLRKTSLDEMPQFFNVLKGDMSLVGPRPPIPYEVENYKSWHLRRILEVRPGLTGLWQVEGRSRVSFDDMVRMDIRYTKTCSLVLDIAIILKTFKVVVFCEGAS